MDESGSMSGEQQWIKPTLTQLFQGLEAAGLDSGANMICSVGYVDRVNRDLGCSFFTGNDTYDDKFEDFKDNGQFEDGYSAMAFGMDLAEDFIVANQDIIDRDCSRVTRTIVLVTDEDRDVETLSITDMTLRNTFTEGDWIVNCILSVFATRRIGFDGSGAAYFSTADSRDLYGVTEAGSVDLGTLSMAGTSREDYAVLAWDFGGVAWNLNELRAGGQSATAFSNAFIDVKIQEIITATSIPTQMPSPSPTAIPTPGLLPEAAFEGCSSFCNIPLIINFDELLHAGDVIDYVDQDSGISQLPRERRDLCKIKVNARSISHGGSNSAMIFDSTCGGNATGCSGGDNDLYKPMLGNSLIISEDGDGSDPDDAKDGGILEFDFSECYGGDVDVCSLYALEFERAFDGRKDLNFTAIDYYGNETTLVAEDFLDVDGLTIDKTEGGLNRLPLDFKFVTGLHISTTDSGAFDEIALCAYSN